MYSNFNQVHELPQSFIDTLYDELNNEFIKHHPQTDIKAALEKIIHGYNYYLVHIDSKPVSLVIGRPEGDQFLITEIYSIKHNGTRDYLYQEEYFTFLNKHLIQEGFSSKKFATLKTSRDDNWIRRSCTEYPLADSYTPTIEETETHTIWTWSFS